jgi:putative transposase
MSWFQNLFDARRKIAAWRKECNEERPHSSLGYRTPKEFAAAQAASFNEELLPRNLVAVTETIATV